MTNETTSTRTVPALWGGVVAGLIGGIAMAMAAMIRAKTLGMSFTEPLQQIAGLLFGADALLDGGTVLISGMMIHMISSMMMGAAFGLIFVRIRSAGVALIVGMIYGAVIWALMTYLVMPMLNPTMSVRVALIPMWWFIYHLIFGAMLLFTPILARAFGGGEERTPVRSAART